MQNNKSVTLRIYPKNIRNSEDVQPFLNREGTLTPANALCVGDVKKTRKNAHQAYQPHHNVELRA